MSRQCYAVPPMLLSLKPILVRPEALRPSLPRPISFSRRCEAGEIVGATLGDDRRRELRRQGAAMTMDDAVSYALANIDPKLLTGPIASIDR